MQLTLHNVKHVKVIEPENVDCPNPDASSYAVLRIEIETETDRITVVGFNEPGQITLETVSATETEKEGA